VAISAINPSPEIFYVAELDRASMYRRGILLFYFLIQRGEPTRPGA
jgi:hypothetical protein